MTRTHAFPQAMLLLLAIGGCHGQGRDNPVSVSVIGGEPMAADPNHGPLSFAQATVLGATAQGLVRYDGAGQIEPGLAIRWAISEDGLYYTFRLADTDAIDAEIVARRLRTIVARNSRNALKPVLGAINEIVAVTPEVIEIRLVAPRPSLLDLLAQPELAVIDKAHPTGPFLVKSEDGKLMTLAPAEPENPDQPLSASERRRRQVMLRGERAASAVARFSEGAAELVLGGRIFDLPIVDAARIDPREQRFDPVTGLFGFTATSRDGFIGNSENRRALAMAIDRDRLVAAFPAPGWTAATAIVAPGTIEVPQPALPGWTAQDLAARRAAARAAIHYWKLGNPGKDASVRVWLPDGPASALLLALVRSDWRTIGVRAVRAAKEDEADLKLIDEVAPSQSANWYLRHFSCEASPVCSETADAALDAARAAADPRERAARFADADLRLAELAPFIPVAQPLRWSLVAPRLTGFKTNNRGVHPLNHLLDDTK